MDKLKLALRLIVIGIFVGLVITLFQYLTHLVINLGLYLIANSITSLIIMLVISLLIYSLVYIVNKKYPGYSGSGLPQLEAHYDKNTVVEPFKMLVLIFINSLYSFFVGLPLGAEGPSISISASLGLFINKLFNIDDNESAMASGSAGFACAFSNPLAGIAHLIEENKHALSLSLILKGLVIMGISYLVNYFLIDETLLPFIELSILPINYYPYLIFVIILIPLVAKLYSYLVVKIKRLSRGNKRVLYLTLILIISFILIRKYLPIITGSGLSMLSIDTLDYSLIILLGFLLFRVLTTSLSVSAYLSGGIVLPTLCIGGLIGLIVVKAVAFFDYGILEYANIFMLVGMFSFLATLTRCPLTALLLGMGVGSLNAIILPLIIGIGLSYLVTALLKYQSIYHALECEYLNTLGL